MPAVNAMTRQTNGRCCDRRREATCAVVLQGGEGLVLIRFSSCSGTAVMRRNESRRPARRYIDSRRAIFSHVSQSACTVPPNQDGRVGPLQGLEAHYGPRSTKRP